MHSAHDLHEFPGDLQGCRAVVMGLGRFGGGVAATAHLVNRGAKVLATDLGRAEDLGPAMEELKNLKVDLRLGEHRTEDFRTADLVIVNPAVPRPWKNRFLEAARTGGARLLTEIRLAIGDRPARNLIGITGTAGKSTTAAMVHHALRRVRPDLDCHLAGNIGGSLLNAPPPPSSTVVLELSSFMLHWLAGDGGDPEDRATPALSTITNVAANHLDWHEDVRHYEACKRAIGHSTPICRHPRILPEVDLEVDADLDPSLRLLVPGEHNRRNARLAVRLAFEHLGIRSDSKPDPALLVELAHAMADFPGLPHRLAALTRLEDEVDVFDDSKSTTPEATCLAVAAFEHENRIHLIAGGYDKGADLSPIANLGPRLAGLHAIGATGRSLTSKAGTYHGTLERAVEAAVKAVRSGDVILLSPGCASWDQFANYEARGAAFARAVDRHRLGRA